MNEVGLGSGRSERRGNLAADQTRLADAGDDDSAPNVLEQIDGGNKRSVEPAGEVDERLSLLGENGARFPQLVEVREGNNV
jgi:hypothetical protein